MLITLIRILGERRRVGWVQGEKGGSFDAWISSKLPNKTYHMGVGWRTRGGFERGSVIIVRPLRLFIGDSHEPFEHTRLSACSEYITRNLLSYTCTRNVALYSSLTETFVCKHWNTIAAGSVICVAPRYGSLHTTSTATSQSKGALSRPRYTTDMSADVQCSYWYCHKAK